MRLDNYVLRASKMLAADNWLGHGYKKRFASPAEVMDFLVRLPVQVLVIDTSLSPATTSAHHMQLREMTKTYPETWRLSGQYDLVRNGQRYPAAIHVYVLTAPSRQPVGNLEVSIEHVLGRKIQELPSPAP
ncbi:MAG: hypothetical protein FJ147_09930 [Deltaproteobacteria bacterium]|nr:hypothetical protein [Deltaproteobacteria bacterium]